MPVPSISLQVARRRAVDHADHGHHLRPDCFVQRPPSLDDAGIGYLGLRFDIGGGTQYGWVRVDMDGQTYNGYDLVDWAYGTPGQVIRIGQTELPQPGTLGLLAVGAVGLLAWRAARRNEAVGLG